MATYSSGKVVGSSANGTISYIAPSAPAKPAAPAKPVPALAPIDKSLAGDSAYSAQMNEANRALNDYVAQKKAAELSYNTDYTRNLYNYNKQEKRDNVDQDNDFASRNMSQSGLFIKSKQDLLTDWNDRDNTLRDGKTQFMANLEAALRNYASTQRINQTRYRNEAINRRSTSLSGGL